MGKHKSRVDIDSYALRENIEAWINNNNLKVSIQAISQIGLKRSKDYLRLSLKDSKIALDDLKTLAFFMGFDINDIIKTESDMNRERVFNRFIAMSDEEKFEWMLELWDAKNKVG